MATKISKFLLFIIAFSSCTTLYKTGQTPDDVYFSPTRPYVETYVENRREEEAIYQPEYRVIRMGINDPRWRNFDQDYRYNTFNYRSKYDNYYSPYYNSYYSPLYSPIYYSPVLPKNTSPRMENLGGYSPVTNYSSTNNKMGQSTKLQKYNNNNSGTAVGNILRQIISPDNSNRSNYINNSNSNNNSNNNNYNNTRTYTPPTNTSSNSSSSSGSSSSGSSSSSGGAISRPARSGGN
jgi:hypothetical protein